MGNPNEAPRFPRKISRGTFIAGALFAPSALLAAASLACQPDPESDLTADPTRVALIRDREKFQATATARAGGSPAPSVPPGRDLLDKGPQWLAERARRLFGMDQGQTDQSSQLKAKEKDKQPTIAVPPPPRPESSKPVEKQKVQSVGEQLKRLKPEELYKILLTNPFSQDKLPKGFVVESGPTPILALAPNLYGLTAIDNLAVPFKPIGKVHFGLKDGKKSYNISYVVFPESNSAKGVFDSLSSQPNVPSIKDFDAPAVLNTTKFDYTIPMALSESVTTISSGSTGVECVILLNNLLVNIGNNESFSFQPYTKDLKTQEARDKELAAQKQQIEQEIQKIIAVQKSAIIPVAKAGIEHLQKITG